MKIEANNPQLKSWVPIPENCDFPIQNLPFGIFSTGELGTGAGVAIGDFVLDLVFLHENKFLENLGLPNGVFNKQYLNDFMALGKPITNAVRNRIAEILWSENPELRDSEADRELALIPMSHVKMQLPVQVGDYTDFYSSIEHATNVGIMFRDPANALLPNWKHIPVGYHGRASSIVVSGTPIVRPKGQIKPEGADVPEFSATNRLDFELEMAFITSKKTSLGDSIGIEEAADHIFGFVLFNDWSARDIQAWEYVPLGPFLGKNFGSSVSPWVVTLEALEPFKCAGPVQDVPVLDYLKSSGNQNFDVNLEVGITPENSNETTVCRSNFKHMYWNAAQQLAHHTVNGCNINVGDMLASGTISGSTPDSFGSMLELAWKGTKPLKLNDGSERKFINDNDTVTMRGYASKNGVRVGFGTVEGKVLPAK
jgi:fumarylacetoacetase